MKVTLDSTDSLKDAVRLVEAMYNVTLTVGSNTESDGSASTTSASGRTSSANRRTRKATTRANGRRRRKSSGSAGRVSSADLRTWARENGYEVNDRGPLPASIAEAYRAAQ